MALAAALATRAIVVFDGLVFVLFAVLWMCFAAALVLRRAELDEFRRAFRRRVLFRCLDRATIGEGAYLPSHAEHLTRRHGVDVGVTRLSRELSPRLRGGA